MTSVSQENSKAPCCRAYSTGRGTIGDIVATDAARGTTVNIHMARLCPLTHAALDSMEVSHEPRLATTEAMDARGSRADGSAIAYASPAVSRRSAGVVWAVPEPCNVRAD